MFKLNILVGIILTTGSIIASAEERPKSLEVRIQGQQSKTWAIDSLPLHNDASTVSIEEPHTKQLVTYKGTLFNDVMNKLFDQRWLEFDEIVFICADGYQSSVPTSKFRQFEAWLTWDRADGKPFRVRNALQANEDSQLGPYYLVWNNQKHKKLLVTGATDFPYQVVAIELVSFKAKFPHLTPDDQASQQIKDGFNLYKQHCLSCHAISGEGGQKGPDLGALSLQKKTSLQLKNWILNPKKVRPQTPMPALALGLPSRDKKAQLIVEYLRYKLKEKNSEPTKPAKP